MLGKTHFTVGIASALLVTQPATVPGVIAAIAAGGIGGKTPDVDCKKIKFTCDSVYDAVIDFLVMCGFLSLDYVSGDGMCRYVLDNWGVPVWIGIAGFCILLLVGLCVSHRTFTHSLLSLVLFSASVFLFCQPAAVPFFAGYASHLVIDLLNKRGIQLFFPLAWKPKLNLCDAGGKVNKLLFRIGFHVDVLVGLLFFASATFYGGSGSQFSLRPGQTAPLGMSALVVYLVFLNLIALFVGLRAGVMQETPTESRKFLWNFETYLLCLTAVLGGFGGALVSLLLQKTVLHRTQS